MSKEKEGKKNLIKQLLKKLLKKKKQQKQQKNLIRKIKILKFIRDNSDGKCRKIRYFTP
jgi:hypothetical protein